MTHSETAIEEVTEVTELTNKQVTLLVKGTDEHLDKLSNAKADISGLATDLNALNLTLLTSVGKSRKSFLQDELLPSLNQLKMSSLVVLHILSNKEVYCDLTVTKEYYNSQVNRLSEIISDLENITLSQNEELDELLRTLSKT